jgi:uncharacterized membrane protein
MGWRVWSAETTLPGLLVVSGLLFAAVLPPGQAPDEHKHFLRAYHVSEGHLWPEAMPEGWAGGDLPEGVGRCADAFKYLRHDIHEKVGAETWRALAADGAGPARRPTSFEGTEGNLFVGYLPQAAAMALGRPAGLNPLGLFYAARLANLALAVLLVSLAIRVTPVGKLVFGMVALLPVTVQQLGSVSPDASTISASFLLTAVLLRAALVGAPAGWGLVARAGGLTAWVTACKFTLAPLALLALAVPRKVLGSRPHYIGGALVLAAAVLLPTYAAITGVGPQLPAGPRDDRPSHTLDAGQQMHAVRDNPLRALGVVGNTVRHLGPSYFDHLFTLGWVDTPIPPLLAYPYAVVLVFVALAGPSPVVPLRMRAAALAAVVACALVIFLALYVGLTAPGATIIFGVQGRYFVPFLPLALLLLSNRSRLLRIDPQRLLALAAAASVAEMIVSLGTMVARYYCPEAWTLWAVGASVIVAAVAAAGIWFAGRQSATA